MKLFGIAVTLIAAIGATAPAYPQQYPSKPVKLVVPFSPGGASDIMARALAQKLSELWRQPVVVENKPGATTTLGAAYVAKSPPDGYTLMLAPPPFVISPHVYPDLGYDRARDFAPISLVAYYPLVLVVNASSSVNSMGEMIALAKTRPGMAYGSVGNGSTNHLASELLRLRTGADIVHIPYKSGGQAVTDLMGDQIFFYFGPTTEVVSHVRSGRLKALAVLATKRSALLPSVPTSQESGFSDIEVSSWSSVVAPAGTPRDIIDRVSADIAKVVAMPDFRERLTSQGAELAGSSPEEAARFIRSEDARWGPLVRSLAVKP